MFKVTNTDKAPGAIGPYSQAIEANGFLFASGQVPFIPETGEIIEGGIEEQADRVCKNIAAILEANGINFESVVKTTCFLAERSCVAVKTLPRNVLCEIEVIAVK